MEVNLANELIRYMRPKSLIDILDRKAGVTPEHRAQLNADAAKEDARLSARAKEIIANMSDDDIDALQYYFGDGA